MIHSFSSLPCETDLYSTFHAATLKGRPRGEMRTTFHIPHMRRVLAHKQCTDPSLCFLSPVPCQTAAGQKLHSPTAIIHPVRSVVILTLLNTTPIISSNTSSSAQFCFVFAMDTRPWCSSQGKAIRRWTLTLKNFINRGAFKVQCLFYYHSATQK